MKRSFLIAGAALLFVTATFAGRHFLSAASTPDSTDKARETDSAVTRWEYLVVAGGHSNLSTAGVNSRMSKQPPDSGFQREHYPLERNLDKLGAQGWELTAVLGTPSEPVYYLKRPRNGE
jgi:hypothetical protein